jgi:hypothetical protein
MIHGKKKYGTKPYRVSPEGASEGRLVADFDREVHPELIARALPVMAKS